MRLKRKVKNLEWLMFMIKKAKAVGRKGQGITAKQKAKDKDG